VSKKATAQIKWIRPSETGASAPPPGPYFSTVARFEDAEYLKHWPAVAWSLVLEYDEPPAAWGHTTQAITSFLVPENAPRHLLRQGVRFQLYVGDKVIAEGTIITPETADSGDPATH
jgi:hypothetical protein